MWSTEFCHRHSASIGPSLKFHREKLKALQCLVTIVVNELNVPFVNNRHSRMAGKEKRLWREQSEEVVDVYKSEWHFLTITPGPFVLKASLSPSIFLYSGLWRLSLPIYPYPTFKLPIPNSPECDLLSLLSPLSLHPCILPLLAFITRGRVHGPVLLFVHCNLSFVFMFDFSRMPRCFESCGPNMYSGWCWARGWYVLCVVSYAFHWPVQ